MIIFFKYARLTVVGLLILLLCSVVQHAEPLQAGEYYYSGFLRNNFTVMSASMFLAAGLFIGCFLKLNPWYSGMSLILIFPLAAFYEATVFRGSHNLIPFELVVYFLFSLPAVLGVYGGRYLRSQASRSKSKLDG